MNRETDGKLDENTKSLKLIKNEVKNYEFIEPVFGCVNIVICFNVINSGMYYLQHEAALSKIM